MSVTNGKKPSSLPQKESNHSFHVKILPWLHSLVDKSLISYRKHVAAFLFSSCVCTQSNSGREPAPQPTIHPTHSTDRKGFRGVLMFHQQTFDSQVMMSRLEVVLNSADNNWVRDDGYYNLWPGSCCRCCRFCSSVSPPIAAWLSAWSVWISCCCSWARQKQKERRGS